MSENLRAAMIGLGMMGRNHARVLGSLPGVDLVVLADANGDPHGCAQGRKLVDSIDAAIAEGIDYAVVAVPTAFHEEVGVKLAEAGVHALIEKPLAVDGVASERLMNAFGAANLVAGVGHIERYNASIQQARARIANGDLGKVIQIATRRLGPFPARIADVGVVKDLATHDIDLIQWVTGQAITSVSARAAFGSGREFEDLVAVTAELADGTVANLLVNWLSPMKERCTTITGEKGAFVADTLTADLTFHANGTVESVWSDIAQFRGVSEGDRIRYAFAKPEPLRVEHEMFRDAVLGKDADIVTLEQGARNVRVAEAIIESYKTRRTIDL